MVSRAFKKFLIIVQKNDGETLRPGRSKSCPDLWEGSKPRWRRERDSPPSLVLLAQGLRVAAPSPPAKRVPGSVCCSNLFQRNKTLCIFSLNTAIYKKKAPFGALFSYMAERKRFELLNGVTRCSLSKGVPSTTRPSLR